MATNAYINTATENYWKLLCNIDDEIKLNLIERLAKSLRKGSYTDMEKNSTAEFIAKFNGAWNGTETPAEILSSIHSHRSSKAPIDIDL
ncbi:MAG: hypothetical protein K2J82_09030 [Muribaculaceae bacterium]|nr:hypothetical protein [Muribaculaceae bacterium]MDE6754737.1 hypothetical protein [Muribaculaceae bacterium]